MISSEVKIPTLFGLAILLIGLTAGVFFVSQKDLLVFKTQASAELSPQKITTANLTPTSVSIFWQTETPTSGFIQAGATSSLNQTFRDDRDTFSLNSYALHFVTLTGLSPNTTYYYKINSGQSFYPAGTPGTFRTPADRAPSLLAPIIGTVIDTGLRPISEALITMEADSGLLASISKIEGNFILPLTTLPNDAVQDKTFNLTVFNKEKSSRVTLKLPVSKNLPPITLGQDLDLTASQ